MKPELWTQQPPPPDRVRDYLSAHGWRLEKSTRHGAEVWRARDRHVLLPETREVADYDFRLEDLVEQIAELEERPALSVAGDLEAAGEDLIRVTIEAGRDRGLPLGSAPAVIAGLLDLVYAATERVVAARFPRDRETISTDYLQLVRLGASEAGSYVFRVLLPRHIRRLSLLDHGLMSDEARVARTLAEMVGWVAAGDEAADVELQPVASPLYQMMASVDSSQISFDFATLESDGDLPRHLVEVSVQSARAIALREPLERAGVGARPRPSAVVEIAEDLEVAGFVEGVRPPSVYVRGSIFGEPRTIRLVVDDETARLAARALADARPVRVRGRIALRPRVSSVLELHEFQVPED
jgi:hypothetical protein